MKKRITQQEYDNVIEWLFDFKNNRLFEIDKSIEILKIKYPNEVITFDTFKQEYDEKIQIFFDNLGNSELIKNKKQQREINELIRYVSIVFQYIENKYK
jgi:hypothetical protein